jgi:hypothetical protein
VGEPCGHTGRSYHMLVGLIWTIRRCNLTWLSGRIQEPSRSMACPEWPEKDDARLAEPGREENAVRPAPPGFTAGFDVVGGLLKSSLSSAGRHGPVCSSRDDLDSKLHGPPSCCYLGASKADSTSVMTALTIWQGREDHSAITWRISSARVTGAQGQSARARGCVRGCDWSINETGRLTETA